MAMETMWYFTQGRSKQQGPVPESQLRGMVAAGTLKAQDLVWREGMKDWTAVRLVGELRPAVSAAVASGATSAVVPPGLTRWMTFVGTVTLVLGILSVLTCVGTLTGILQIVGGVALLGARTALRAVPDADSALEPFFRKLNTFMTMCGACYIVIILGMIVWAGIVVLNLMGLIALGVPSP